MITDGERSNGVEKYHYLAVKSISALFRGITSSHNRDFYCLNCLQLLKTKEKLKKHEKLCNNHDYCYVKMSNEYERLSKYNPGEKSLTVLFIIYTDLECLLKKRDTCQKDPKKSSTEKKLSIHLHVTHGLHAVHLMNKKTNRFITEEETV